PDTQATAEDEQFVSNEPALAVFEPINLVAKYAKPPLQCSPWQRGAIYPFKLSSRGVFLCEAGRNAQTRHERARSVLFIGSRWSESRSGYFQVIRLDIYCCSPSASPSIRLQPPWPGVPRSHQRSPHPILEPVSQRFPIRLRMGPTHPG